MAKGNFIEYVVSNNPNKYPNDGEQSGYYWELYGGPKTLISFMMATTSGYTYGPYQAEEGMTWEEFVNSNYNTNGDFSIVDTHIYYAKKGSGPIAPTLEEVAPSYVIKNDMTYYFDGNGLILIEVL